MRGFARVHKNPRSLKGSEILIKKLCDPWYWSNEGKGETGDVLSSMVVNVLWHRKVSVHSNSSASC